MIKVCVLGLGFVGSAMAAATAAARDEAGHPWFEVAGLELPTPAGVERVARLNRGEFPFPNTDQRLTRTLAEVHRQGNLRAAVDPAALREAQVVVVDVGLDLGGTLDHPTVALEGFRRAVRTVGERIPPGCLVMVETTVPPGTCERVVAPELAQCFARRGLPEEGFLLAHAYERVMPGADYLASIVDFWRVYAGLTPEAADACEAFLSKVVNVREFPLTRLSSVRASETAKVLENSFRAVTIALMEEWGRFAEAADFDLFEVVEAIRQRPTHANMRWPGFGVGGYCLTKDTLFAEVGARQLLGLEGLEFPFCREATRLNQRMPLATLALLRRALGGESLAGRRWLLLGVSYRPEVADTRQSPSQTFVEAVRVEGGEVVCHDPLVRHWEELNLDLPPSLPDPAGFDGVVFAVAHEFYRQLDLSRWLAGWRGVVIDANGVLTAEQRQQVAAAGCGGWGVGRGRFA
ncbi:MAG: nucleotide sugar dehydrogenase [Magnetococcales bacterium]|nr:nucleotide sugar dehydrogenase [Magnetococcales bacterium]